MSDPIIDKGISRLVYQFSDSEKFKGFLTAFLAEYEELNISGLQLLNERYLDTAIGIQLDGIGEIVGLSRPYKDIDVAGVFGFFNDPTALSFGDLYDLNIGGNFLSFGANKAPIGDDLYRLLIRAKIIKNQTAMTVDDTTRLISFTFGGIPVRYFLTTNLKPRYDIEKILTPFEVELLSDFPILIGIDSVDYHSMYEDGSFSFLDDLDATGLGFGSFDTDLIGYWAFDTGTGAIAKDSSQNSNSGSLINAPVWVNGVSGKALSFDHTANQRVEIADFPELDFGTGDFSVSCWVKINAFYNQGSTWNSILYRDRLVVASSYGFVFNASGIVRFYIDSTPVEYPVDIIDGNWHHIVGIRESNIMSIYVDTIIGASTANAININSSAPLVIGGDTLSIRYLNGLVDEVRLYDKALTTQEIQTLYSNPGGVDIGGKFAQIIT